LECGGAFTAAFARAARSRTNKTLRPFQSARGLAHSKTLARMTGDLTVSRITHQRFDASTL